MKSNIIKNEKSVIDVSVSANPEAWKKAVNVEIEKAAENVEVDGFRKGKAPLAKAKQHINIVEVLDSAANSMLNDMYIHVLDEHKITPMAPPQLSYNKISEDELEVLFNIAVKPEFKLGEYKGLSAKKEVELVEEAEIDAQIDALKQQAVSLEVADKAIEMGDTAVIDFEGFKDGVAFEGGKAESFPLEIGSGQFIPGFEEQLVGKKAGEVLDVDVTFPEDYQSADLANQPVVFKVNIHEVKVKVEKEFNDEFVAALGIENVTNIAELKEDISKKLLEQKHQDAENKYTNDLLMALSDSTEIDIPQMLIDSEIKNEYDQFMQRLQQQGLNEELYFQLSQTTKEDVENQLLDNVMYKIKNTFILEEIVEQEKLEVSKEEVEAEYQKMAEMYGMEVDKIKEMLPDNSGLEFELRIQKAIQFVKDNAK